MTDEFKIERISESNFNDFVYLIEKLAEYEKLEPPDDEAKVRLKRDGLSEDPKYEAYLGFLNGKPIGYIIFFFTYSSFLAMPTLYLEDILILEEYRRKGFGEKLFNFCVKQAQLRECGRMEWCVLTWNEPAIKFYEKIGASRLNWFFYRLTKEEFMK
ncbi:MAG: GNAT family N-acetyltransferase [Candidatus Helarchaeota archaeon]|nr:GNAT family N-acetyltransferase [Candidatus Helarchaeota archaeon]